MVSKNKVWRARLRPIVGLAGAGQGRPKLTRTRRVRGSVGGSTVDPHRPDRDLALKDCAPGILCQKLFQL